MTSPIRQKCSSVLACIGILVLLAVIVVIWVQFGYDRTKKPEDRQLKIQETVSNENLNRKDNGKVLIETTYLGGSAHPSDIEFVKPLKISPPPLHDHDIIYDQLHNTTDGPVLRHHSGHFRHKTAEVWDPHPRYEIRAFGRVLILELAYNDKLVSPNLKMFNLWENYTEKVKHEHSSSWCYYYGIVKGDNDSNVSVSLCNGMTGYIRTSDANYQIEPIEKFHVGDATSSILHRIRKIPHKNEYSNNNIEQDGHTSFATDDVFESDETSRRRKRDVDFNRERRNRQNFWPRKSIEFGARRKRTNNEYIIEILIVADKATYEYHGTEDNLKHYVLTLMSHVLLLFKDPSIGNAMSISVVDIWTSREKDFSSSTSNETLQKFCDWQNKYSHDRHDVTLLLTRETICKTSTASQTCNNHNTLGVADVGSMCSPSSCIIAIDNGLSSSYTIAHELGHALGMPHDEQKKCEKFFGGIKKKNIMSGTLQNDTIPWLWSACSKHYLTEFLESGQSKCLLDTASRDFMTPEFTTILPGQNFEVDRQCELEFGAGSKKCPYAEMPKCKSLYCTNQAAIGGCKTQHMPWADGTTCDDFGERWCYHGECIAKRVLTPVAGGWGPWYPWGPCTRTCGGGVMASKRICNNPSPAHGGDYCVGKSVRYQSCNSNQCDPETPNFREQQCAEFNGNSKGITGLDSSVKWVPKYGATSYDEDMCKLYCRVAKSNAYYLLKEKVADGTKCDLNSFDICVNGICKPGGCDNELNSNKTLDECGVCAGDNSKCEEISGTYNITSYGYNRVVKIPKGSSNIKIWQRGHQNDDNYLALKDEETSEYILNGKLSVSRNPKDLVYGGLTLKYSGTEPAVELLTTAKNRKLTKNLILLVLSVGDLRPPDITYRYTINKENAPRYAWRVYEKEWSECSSICSGTQYMRPVCVELAVNALVPDKRCADLDMNGIIQQQDCNTHCQLSWNAIYRGPCTGHCGLGTQKVLYNCVKTDLTIQHFKLIAEPQFLGTIVDDKHCLTVLQKPLGVEECQGPCEATRWKYTDWTECSKSCGGGIQRRSGKCVDENSRNLDDNRCDADAKVTEQICNIQRCPVWAFGDWTPCSVTCGKGYRTKPYYCNVDGRILPQQDCNMSELDQSSINEECFEKPCVRWSIGPWKDCSASCGQGVQRRDIFCLALSGEAVEESLCADLLKPNDTKGCTGENCQIFRPYKRKPYYSNDIEDNSVSVAAASTSSFRWTMGAWSQCSKSCDSGRSSRVVVCRNDFGEENEHMCNQLDKPIHSMDCNTHPCPGWNYGAWSKCDDNCERHRQVSCQSLDGTIVDVSLCESNIKPPDMSKCRAEECSRNFRERKYKWKVGKWTQCSKSCGKGTKTRQVFCKDVVKDVTLVDQYCSHVRRPKSTKICERNNCDFAWVESDWSQCSRNCNVGVKRRNVTCHKVLIGGYVSPSPIPEPYSNMHPRNFCDLYNKPSETTECIERNCTDIYSWRPGTWRQCTQPCGRKGRQTRQLFCVTQDGKRVRKSYCPLSLKPERKRRCNQTKCLYRNCKDVKRKLNTMRNGDYLMSIHGKAALVYCFKMDTENPEEFISLQGNTQNYAEFYDKRLRNTDSCPFYGERRENCDCIPEDSGSSGYTIFWKVRLNITSLEIMRDVHTFSSESRGRPILYGTAGDCYSRVSHCPQGQFSVDLTGTSFKISKRVNWIARGHQASVDLEREEQRVRGRCGGYCGTCEPDPYVGLLVEVT